MLWEKITFFSSENTSGSRFAMTWPSTLPLPFEKLPSFLPSLHPLQVLVLLQKRLNTKKLVCHILWETDSSPPRPADGASLFLLIYFSYSTPSWCQAPQKGVRDLKGRKAEGTEMVLALKSFPTGREIELSESYSSAKLVIETKGCGSPEEGITTWKC